MSGNGEVRVGGPVERVMVGTDRSQTAERAVAWAAAFADRYGADLHIVQVILPGSPTDTEFGAAEATRARGAADELQIYARQVAGEKGHAHVVINDDPAMAIVDATEEHAIDVLVVGNAGMAGRKEFLLGNVPNRISHNARCTVIIVNTAEGQTAGPAGVRRAPASLRAGTVEVETQPHLMARGTKIATVFAKHGLKELFGRPDEEGALGRERQGKRLRAALEELGPTFAKLGQILSTRPDLLPPEYIKELATLQDNVPPLTEEQVVRVMEQELGVPWEDVFDHIEAQPLAAGTIAEVHRATLANGEKVVVKVQRPDAKEQIEQDLALLEVFAEKVGTPAGAQAGDRHGGGVLLPLRFVAPRARLPAGGGQHAPDDGRDRAVLAAARPRGPRRLLDVAAAGDARRRRRPDRRARPRGRRAQGGRPPAAGVVLQADHGRRLLPRRPASGEPDVAARGGARCTSWTSGWWARSAPRCASR